MTQTNNGNGTAIKVLVPILTFLLGLTVALGFSQMTLGQTVAKHDLAIFYLQENDTRLTRLMEAAIAKIPDAKVTIK
jgi:hypothetical protein